MQANYLIAKNSSRLIAGIKRSSDAFCAFRADVSERSCQG